MHSWSGGLQRAACICLMLIPFWSICLSQWDEYRPVYSSSALMSGRTAVSKLYLCSLNAALKMWQWQVGKQRAQLGSILKLPLQWSALDSSVRIKWSIKSKTCFWKRWNMFNGSQHFSPYLPWMLSKHLLCQEFFFCLRLFLPPQHNSKLTNTLEKAWLVNKFCLLYLLFSLLDSLDLWCTVSAVGTHLPWQKLFFSTASDLQMHEGMGRTLLKSHELELSGITVVFFYRFSQHFWAKLVLFAWIFQGS